MVYDNINFMKNSFKITKKIQNNKNIFNFRANTILKIINKKNLHNSVFSFTKKL